MRYFVTLAAREISVDVTALPGGGFDVRAFGRRLDVEAVAAGGAISVRIDGRVVDLVLDGSPPNLGFSTIGPSGGATVETERTRSDGARRTGQGAREDFVVAPMPGRIVRLLVSAGTAVEPGAPL